MRPIDPATLSQWFDAYSAELALYARQWLKADQAEDVVQDVFVRLGTQRRRPKSPKAWLFRSVRNAAISHLRSHRRRQRHEAASATAASAMFDPDPAAPIDAASAQRILESLSQALREVVVLRIWGQMTLREISEVLDRPTSTVFDLYRSALEQIRQRMTESCETKKD